MRLPWRRRHEVPFLQMMAFHRALSEFLMSRDEPNASLIYMSQLYGLGFDYDQAKDAVERAGGTVDESWPKVSA